MTKPPGKNGKPFIHGCPRCGSEVRIRNGSILSPRGRVQRYQCVACGKKYHMALKHQPIILKEGYLDIEASGLKANFDIMYTWAIKPRGSDDILSDVIKPWTPTGEKRIVASLIRAMRKFDRIITYNGTLYDIPFIRTRALRYSLNPPEYMEMYHHDLYFVAKNRLCLHRKNLETVARALGVGGKTAIDPKHWEQAMFHDNKALAEIHRHNLGDVVVLEGVHRVLEPFYFGVNKSI